MLRVPLEFVGAVERGALLSGQRKVSKDIRPGQRSGEVTPVSPFSESTTRRTAVTSYKSALDWRRVGRYGLPSTVGGVIVSHWSATWTDGRSTSSRRRLQDGYHRSRTAKIEHRHCSPARDATSREWKTTLSFSRERVMKILGSMGLDSL